MSESLSRRPAATLPSLHLPLLVSFLLAGQGCLMILRGVALIAPGAALNNQPEKRGIRSRESAKASTSIPTKPRIEGKGGRKGRYQEGFNRGILPSTVEERWSNRAPSAD